MLLLPGKGSKRAAFARRSSAPLNSGDAPTRAPAAPATAHLEAIPLSLATRSTQGAPPQPPSRPAALGSRRIGAAASGRRVLGPLARPIPRLEPARAPARQFACAPAAQPPPRSAPYVRCRFSSKIVEPAAPS